MSDSVKMNPELRHVLAHMIYAIDCLVAGNTAEAAYELESIRGLVFWDSDKGQTADAEEWKDRTDEDDGEEDHQEELQEELQKTARQEETPQQKVG